MPRRPGGFTPLESLSFEDRARELTPEYQRHWYQLCSELFEGLSVLDVGAGTGYGLKILGTKCRCAFGIDAAPTGGDVMSLDISAIPSNACDAATAIDVVEHVEDDVSFFGHLLRVARRYVFFSTPNYDVYRAANRFHVREYTPGELRELLLSFGHRYESWTSDARNRVEKLDHLIHGKNNFGVLVNLKEGL